MVQGYSGLAFGFRDISGGFRIYLGLVQGVFSLASRNSEEAVKEQKIRETKSRKPKSPKAERQNGGEAEKEAKEEPQKSKKQNLKSKNSFEPVWNTIYHHLKA